MTLIDGRLTANKIIDELTINVRDHVSKGYRPPHLVAVLVGDHTASATYVRTKIKACESTGMKSSLIKMSSDVSQDTLQDRIHDLNSDPAVDGFIVQLPLPEHIDEQSIIMAIDPDKDVDGFHPTNLGKLMLGLPTYLPATPAGILTLLERHGIHPEGMNCAIVGRSHIVGTPMSLLLSRKDPMGNATVTLTHSRTKNLKEITKMADLLIAAIGRPHFITADMVKDGAVVIDVGINRVDDASKKRGYRLVGDVDFDGVRSKVKAITPVPGGVGPMTVVSLLQNTMIAAQRRPKPA